MYPSDGPAVTDAGRRRAEPVHHSQLAVVGRLAARSFDKPSNKIDFVRHSKPYTTVLPSAFPSPTVSDRQLNITPVPEIQRPRCKRLEGQKLDALSSWLSRWFNELGAQLVLFDWIR